MGLDSMYSSHMLTETQILERLRRAQNRQDDAPMYSSEWSYCEGLIYAYTKVLNKAPEK